MKFIRIMLEQCLKITQDVVFEFWHFPPIFILLKVTLKVGIFDNFLSTQNVNIARFARNVECDFLGDFQTL